MPHKPTFPSLAEHARSWVSPRELARYHDCHERSVRRMILAGSIKAYRVGRTWRIPLEDAKTVFTGKLHVSRETH